MDAAGAVKLAALYILANNDDPLTISPRQELAEWPHRRSTPLGNIISGTLVLDVNLIVNLQIRHDNKSSAWMVSIILPSTLKQISPFQQMEQQYQTC